jgi:hypothetical protein
MKGKFIRLNSVLVRMRFLVHRYVAAPIFPTKKGIFREFLCTSISVISLGRNCVESETVYMGWKKKQQSCDRRGWSAQRPVMRVNEPKKTGARGHTGA